MAKAVPGSIHEEVKGGQAACMLNGFRSHLHHGAYRGLLLCEAA